MTSKLVVIFGISFCSILNITFGSQSTLKEFFKNDFLIGTAINQDQFYENNIQEVDIIKAQFNSITSENILKWESVHPSLNEYAFEADVFLFVQDQLPFDLKFPDAASELRNIFALQQSPVSEGLHSAQ